MKDFLTFQTFITPSLLIFIYYIGAVFIPLVSWYLVHWIKTVYFSQKDTHSEIEITVHITFRQRLIMYTIFLISFLSMEILWRIMIEFFIAYFDMHDALIKLV
jgi:hypothetical protein